MRLETGSEKRHDGVLRGALLHHDLVHEIHQGLLLVGRWQLEAVIYVAFDQLHCLAMAQKSSDCKR